MVQDLAAFWYLMAKTGTSWNAEWTRSSSHSRVRVYTSQKACRETRGKI